MEYTIPRNKTHGRLVALMLVVFVEVMCGNAHAAMLTGSTATGAVASNGGDASNTTVKSAAPDAVASRTLALRVADRVPVADYASNGIIGGATITSLIQPQTTSDTVMFVGSGNQLATGKFVTSPLLPVGTTITGTGGPIATLLTETTNATTLTNAEAIVLSPMPGLSNQLSFPTVFGVPIGATVSGPGGIPAGTTVFGVTYPSGGGTLVYLSAQVTSNVPAGAVVTFGYTYQAVFLSNQWTAPAAVGTQVGLATQDDTLAFQNAAYFLAPQNGGPGGRIFVPSGTYYIASNVTTYNGVSFELGDTVAFVPGSGAIDIANGGYAATASDSIFAGYRNPTATAVNISQVLEQSMMPDLQGQGLLINQLNASCTNNGSTAGCGMVGAEVKQAFSQSITRGIVWQYHGTDTFLPGQNLGWIGAELELLNNSGVDVKWDSQEGDRSGLHIDDVGNTNNTVVLLPGASGTGKWHRVMDCNSSAVLDYCFTIPAPPIAADGTPTMLAALDMTGHYTGAGIAITGNGSVSGAVTVGTIQAAGSIITAPSATAYTLQSSDCGTTLEPLPVSSMSITVPTGLPAGCKVDVNEVNTLPISFLAGAGETLRSLGGAHTISGNYGSARVLVDGVSSFLLSGNIQ